MHYFVKLELTRSDFRQPELAMRKLRLLNYTLHYTPQKNIANPLILFGYFQPNDGVNLQVPGSSRGRGAKRHWNNRHLREIAVPVFAFADRKTRPHYLHRVEFQRTDTGTSTSSLHALRWGTTALTSWTFPSPIRDSVFLPVFPRGLAAPSGK